MPIDVQRITGAELPERVASWSADDDRPRGRARRARAGKRRDTDAVIAEARAVLERIYEALEAGNRDTLLELLAPDLDAELAAGMPAGAGPHRGAESMINDGWWAIGRAFAVRAVPQEWIACADDRVLVQGRYRGTARATGRGLDAAFDHLWTVRDGRAVALRQLTDTALWVDATDPDGAP